MGEVEMLVRWEEDRDCFSRLHARCSLKITELESNFISRSSSCFTSKLSTPILYTLMMSSNQPVFIDASDSQVTSWAKPHI